MTTQKDNYKLRVDKDNIGLAYELGVGIPDDGMQNASGDYPKREYNFGSSINKAALGTKVNKLYTGGGDVGVPLNIPEQMQSQYPFNQVDETPSGHSIEMDDTPGGERILIRHRKGSGVELRADGSVVISALNNKVEVTGGDQTVIIEGHGNLVYNGNLNLKVSGDYNVEVGGNYNIDVAGDRSDTTKRNHKQEVTGDLVEKYLGSKTTKTIGNNNEINLSDLIVANKGTFSTVSEGSTHIASGKDLFISSKSILDLISEYTNVTGVSLVNVKGQEGLIGGPEVRYTGQTYSGAKDTGDDFDTAIFHGTFKGTADKAIHAQKANTSVSSLIATNAVFAERAGWSATISSTILGASAGGPVTFTTPHATPVPVVVTSTALATAAAAVQGVLAVQDMLASFPQETESGHITIQTNDLVDIKLGTVEQYSPPAVRNDDGTFDMLTPINKFGQPIQQCIVDAGGYMREQIKGLDHYEGYFEREPTIQEIRSTFRNSSARNDIGPMLILEGKISSSYQNILPPKLSGRVVGKEAGSKYGYTPIGNSLDNRGKRFRK
jgi:hypothetical protein